MRTLTLVFACIIACAVAPLASAHASFSHSTPTAGATLRSTPQDVRIWFNSEIEPAFSTIKVTNAAGKQVSTGKGEVSSKDHTLLETTIPSMLPAGKYQVHWSVIAHDGHRTEGHYAFTLE